MSPDIRIRVNKYKGFAETLQTASRYIPVGSISKRLPAEGQYFDLVFLSLLRAESPDVFFHLLREVYVNVRKTQALAYLSYRTERNLWTPKSFLSISVPFGLYSVSSPNTALPDSLFPSNFGKTPHLDLFFA
ncbi:MAG: hypothetical protein KDD25_01480 [Bdellovibrionales bacterium]|nr:hypothetical protein [Bdellovibrionales bacterium]